MINLPYLATFSVAWEDYATLVDSSRFFDVDGGRWFTEGFRVTLADYPELGRTSGIVKPVSNASLYLDSLISPAPDSVLMMTTNYVGHAVAVGLCYIVARRLLRLTVKPAILAAALFAGTTSTELLLEFSAFRGDMLGATFGLGAVVAADSFLKTTRVRWAALTLGLLILSVFSKETAFVTPLVVALYVVSCGENEHGAPGVWKRARNGIQRHPVLLATLSLPLVAYLVVRFVLAEGGDIAVLGAWTQSVAGIPYPVANLIRAVPALVFPIERVAFSTLLSGTSDGGSTTAWLAAIRAIPAALAGAGILGFTVVALLRSETLRWRYALVGGMGLVSAAVPLLIDAKPRYLYLAQALLLPVVVGVFWEATSALRADRRARWRRRFAIAFVVLGPVYLVTSTLSDLPSRMNRNDLMSEYQVALERVFSEPTTTHVYYLNGSMGGGGLGKLRFYASLAGRDDVVVRLVNQLDGIDGKEGSGSVEFVEQGEWLQVTVEISGEERFFLGFVGPGEAELLGVPDVIKYGPIGPFKDNALGQPHTTQEQLIVWVADRPGTVVIGSDPGTPGVHLRTADRPWSPLDDG